MLQVYNHVNLLIGWVVGKGGSFFLVFPLWLFLGFFCCSLGALCILPVYLVALFLWYVFIISHHYL